MKKSLLVAIVLAASCLSAWGQTAGEPKTDQETSKKLQDLQAQIDRLKAKDSSRETDVQAFVRQLEVQLAQIQELTGKIDQYRSRLAAALAEKAGGAADLQYARQQAEKLHQDLVAALEKTHAEMAREKKVPGENVDQAKEPVAEGRSRPRKPLEGKVTATSNEIGLVVISIGKEDGVLEGDEFTVCRGGDFVAKIRIDRVDQKWAAGKIILKKSDPRVADDVANHVFVSSPRVTYAIAKPASGSSGDEIRALRKELDEVRAQVRTLSDRMIPSWQSAGVTVEDVPEDLRSHLGIAGGLIVRTVREGSAAERLGLRSYDVIPGKAEAEVLRSVESGASLRVLRGGRALELPGAKRP